MLLLLAALEACHPGPRAVQQRAQKIQAEVRPVVARQLAAAARAAEAATGVPRTLIMAVVEHESRYNPQARRGPDQGPMQVRPITKKELQRLTGTRLNIQTLEGNIAAGAALLAILKRRHRSWALALTAYNKGSAGLRADGYRVSRYAQRVLRRWAAVKKAYKHHRACRP